MAAAQDLRARLGERTIVLVGMMGGGKSSVGRQLAARLKLPFVDADTEIEQAANMTVEEIFHRQGESYFRAGEHRVIARLLGQGPQVLATGGGAYMNADTRRLIAQSGVSVWLRADFDTLFDRVSRRTNRPLLQNPDPAGVLRRLMEQREPVYAEVDISVDSRNVPHEQVVSEVVVAMNAHLRENDDR
ncbi:shikimate kinase [Breoghania sp.]|uniref:shikimate kinase n=1 Tax=Breoghania sp. TaxID=2065378 RepID=UPI00262BE22B|nr:shikimate kinase [Breoghania sp.]MDJ0933143.1 shikimate kinase [Breoghania sp.]